MPYSGGNMVSCFLARRKNRPMFFIDIAVVPRTVEPEMNRPGWHLRFTDIDDLQQAVTSHVDDGEKKRSAPRRLSRGEVERFKVRLQTLDVVSTIVSLQDHLETIRQAEIDRGCGQGRLVAALAGTGAGGRSTYAWGSSARSCIPPSAR